jgi:ankyrin repeat protein
MEKEFFKAVKLGDLARVNEMLAASQALVDAVDADASTPLHYAAWKGHPEIAEQLIAAGANVAARNTNSHWGNTPLHAAAHANAASVVTVLLAHGADAAALDDSGKTPLDHTKIHGAKAAARVLISSGR